MDGHSGSLIHESQIALNIGFVKSTSGATLRVPTASCPDMTPVATLHRLDRLACLAAAAHVKKMPIRTCGILLLANLGVVGALSALHGISIGAYRAALAR